MPIKLSNWHKAIAAGLFAQLIWGVAGPMVKVVLYAVPPFSLLFLRCLFAALILFVIYEVKWSKTIKFTQIPFQDKKDIFWAGFYGVFLNIALYFMAQKLTTVSDAWIIGSSGTIFVVVLSYVFMRERLAKTVYLGIGLAFLGTLVIIGTPLLQAGTGSPLGNILMVGATLSAALSTFFTKRVVDKYPPLFITFCFFLVSVVCSLPFFLWEFVNQPTWMADLSGQSMLIITYLVLGSSILAYYFYTRSLVVLSPSIASTIAYSGAAISIGLSILFLHETLTIFFIVGAILIAIGLFLAETRHWASPRS